MRLIKGIQHFTTMAVETEIISTKENVLTFHIRVRDKPVNLRPTALFGTKTATLVDMKNKKTRDTRDFL